MDGATANARRKYHHVHYGGKLTEHDIAGMVRGMENKDAEIARLTAERDQALARAAAAATDMRERAAVEAYKGWESGFRYITHEKIRALPIDPDATEALNQMLAEAFKAGQRGMRERAAEKCKWHSDKLVETIRALPIKERSE